MPAPAVIPAQAGTSARSFADIDFALLLTGIPASAGMTGAKNA